jgi:hypothetical protein
MAVGSLLSYKKNHIENLHGEKFSSWELEGSCGQAPSVKKKPSVTQDQNMWVTENSEIHIDRSEKSA